MNKDFPALSFPAFRFRVRPFEGGLRIWDEVRGAWLVLTPEEWVRRHLVRFLTEHIGLEQSRVSEECPVCLNGMNQRADVVVYNRDGTPLLLAECKAPSVNVDGSVYAQAVRYNTVLGAEYIMLTNGLKHYIYQRIGDGNYRRLDRFPDLHGV